MTGVQFVLQQLILSSEGIIHAFCYERMLRRRDPAGSRLLRIVSFWLIYIVILSFSWMTGVRISGAVNLLFALLFTLLLMRIFYDEKLLTEIFAFVFLFLMQILADIAVSVLYTFILGHESANYMEDQMIPILILALSLDALLELYAARLWARRQRRRIRFAQGRLTGAFLAVILICLFFVALGIVMFQGGYQDSWLTTASLRLGSLFLFLGFCLFYQQKQEKKNEVEWENLRRICSQQEAFFRNLEEQERRTSFIRHDHLNVLAAVSQMLAMQETEEACRLLEAYSSRILEKDFSEAVLNSKRKL